MRRISLFSLLALAGFASAGCGSLGWYRALGHYPGVAPSDYAFYNFWGTSSQLYQFGIPLVQSSALQALGDLGFRSVGRPQPCPDGSIVIEALTPDERPAHITLTPQNNLTNMRIQIGPACVGDEMLSHDVFKRISVSLGTAPRTYTPLEAVLSRRTRCPTPLPQLALNRAETLIGEGLQPGEAPGTVQEEAAQTSAPTVAPVAIPGYFGPNLLTPPPYLPFDFGLYGR